MKFKISNRILGITSQFTFLSLAIGCLAYAPAALALRIGPKAGYGYSMPHYTVDGQSVQSFSNKDGFVLGASAEESFGPVGGFVDLLYAKRVLGFGGASQTFNYIEVPVMANLDLGLLRLNGGVYYAFSFGKIRTCANDQCASTSYNVPAVNIGSTVVTYHRNDYGFVAGAGIGLPIPGITASLDLSFHLGLKDIGSGNGMTTRWRGVDLIAGVAF